MQIRQQDYLNCGLFFGSIKKKINIYSDSKTIKYLTKTQRYLFKKTPNYPAIFKANTINSNFSLGNLKEKINFKSLSLKHGKIKSLAYIFEKTAYISDCNDFSINNIDDLKNLNKLVID